MSPKERKRKPTSRLPEEFRHLVWTPTFERFVRIYCSVSGTTIERGPTNALILVRPSRPAGKAGVLFGHVVAISYSVIGLERIRVEPVGSFRVARMGNIEVSLAGGYAGAVAKLVEVADAGWVKYPNSRSGRAAFLAKLSEAELEFTRLR